MDKPETPNITQSQRQPSKSGSHYREHDIKTQTSNPSAAPRPQTSLTDPQVRIRQGPYGPPPTNPPTIPLPPIPLNQPRFTGTFHPPTTRLKRPLSPSPTSTSATPANQKSKANNSKITDTLRLNHSTPATLLSSRPTSPPTSNHSLATPPQPSFEPWVPKTQPPPATLSDKIRSEPTVKQ